MNLIVCVKQVPRMNVTTGYAKIHNRTHENSIINPYDMYALETALRLREVAGGTVMVLSMGRKSVIKNLLELLALGADQAVLLNDTRFAGADTLATAYTLSMGIKKIGTFDLILCGRRSSDGNTSQVGPALAEMLGVPCAANVTEVNTQSSGLLRCHRATTDSRDTVEIAMPAVLTIHERSNIPRQATLKNLIRCKNKEIILWALEDIEADKSRCGSEGSPTQLVKIGSAKVGVRCNFLTGNCSQIVTSVIDIVEEVCCDKIM